MAGAKLALALFSAVAVTSCASFEGSIAPYLAIEDVADNVQCELQAAYAYYQRQPEYAWLENWAASFAITLKRQDKAGVGPKVEFSEPNIFGVGAAADVSSDSIRTLTTKRTVLLNQLPRYHCSLAYSGAPLTGRLGLLESLGDSLRAHNAGDVIKPIPDDLGYRIDFSIRAGASAAPSWIVTRIPSIGFGVSASRETTHVLDIAFADATEKPAGPLEVFITNWPTGLLPPQAPMPAQPTEPDRPQTRRRVQPAPATVQAPPATVPFLTRQKLDSTLQRLQLESLLPRLR